MPVAAVTARLIRCVMVPEILWELRARARRPVNGVKAGMLEGNVICEIEGDRVLAGAVDAEPLGTGLRKSTASSAPVEKFRDRHVVLGFEREYIWRQDSNPCRDVNKHRRRAVVVVVRVQALLGLTNRDAICVARSRSVDSPRAQPTTSRVRRRLSPDPGTTICQRRHCADHPQTHRPATPVGSERLRPPDVCWPNRAPRCTPRLYARLEHHLRWPCSLSPRRGSTDGQCAIGHATTISQRL